MTYPDPAGDPCLRQAIASYLAVARGIECSPSSVFVTTGFAGALGVIARALLSRGDAVWLEDPGFPRTREALTLAGALVVPVRVDASGIDVEQGVARGVARGSPLSHPLIKRCSGYGSRYRAGWLCSSGRPAPGRASSKTIT